MKNIMIDLETMSLKPNAAIISIGAVAFEPMTRSIIAEFKQNVTLGSCAEFGLHISDDTQAWWAKQDRDLRDALTVDAVPLPEALTKLKAFVLDGLMDKGDVIPWSNGAGFDIPILEHAYHACGMTVPWLYFNISCYRTLKRIYKSIRIEFNGKKHDALDDARHQAVQLMEIMAIMTKAGDIR